jgi:hypothetical protein
MGNLKEGPPEVAPHVVFTEMADVAHKYGYGLQFNVTLIYYLDGEKFTSTVKRQDNDG